MLDDDDDLSDDDDGPFGAPLAAEVTFTVHQHPPCPIWPVITTPGKLIN